MFKQRGRRDHYRMVVGLTTTCAISAYHHYSCEFKSHSYDKVCQRLETGHWFSLSTPVSYINKTDRHLYC